MIPICLLLLCPSGLGTLNWTQLPLREALPSGKAHFEGGEISYAYPKECIGKNEQRDT